MLRVVYLMLGSSGQTAWVQIVCQCVETWLNFATLSETDNYLLYFNQTDCQKKIFSIVLENSGNPRNDIQKIQYW